MNQVKEVSMKTPLKENSNEVLPYYMADPIFQQFQKAKRMILESDQDRIYVVTGREGLGKSKLARQLAYSIDPTISLDRIVFTSEDFKSAIKKAKKGQAIIFDECFRGLSSKGSISKENKELVELLMECRQLNLVIFLVLPSFFLLEKYAAIFRSTALFNVMASKKNFKLRYFKVYNYHQKKLLYIFGKQMMDYSKPKIKKSWRFYNKEVPSIDFDAYKVKKEKSLHTTTPKQEIDKKMQQRNYLLYILHKEHNYTYVKLNQVLKDGGFSINESVIGRYIRDVAKKDKRQETSIL